MNAPSQRAHPIPTGLRRAAVAALCAAAAGCAAAASPPPSQAPPATSPLDARIDSILAGLTLEQKVGQLTIAGGRADLRDLVRAGRIGGTNGVLPGRDVYHYTHEMQALAMASPPHLPLLFMGDVIHGFRTIFPVPLAMAATWDTALVRRADSVAAREATAAGVTWTFAPMLDIARDPRWGRVVESPGEDPFLGAAMARAAVTGYQGTGLAAPTTMAATAKHFAGYGAVEAGRDYNTVDLSERRFRDVYLPTFHAARNAGVATVMAAFTALDGVPATADRALITGILRDEWGFPGLVVSDYDAISELQSHGVAASPADAAAEALRAGVDVDLHSTTYLRELPSLARAGRVPESAVDEAVRRVLRLKLRLGLLDDPFRYADSATALGPLPAAHRALARRLARESMVLLRNEGGVLPLRKDLRALAVLGPLADDSADPLGPVHALGRPEDAVTLLAGIRRAVAPRTRVLYARGVAIGDPTSRAAEAGTSRAGAADTAGIAQAVRAARAADAAVVAVGESAAMSGEGGSRARLGLPGRQLALVRAVLATGTPTVVVVLSGRPLAIPVLAARAPALLEAWLPGTEAGSALADVLFGDEEPSGRLPVTFPRAVGQVPIYYAHLETGRPASPTDRYTSKYLDVPVTPLFPFGYGLGYTTFRYDALRLGAERIRPGDTLAVRVDVTNTGARAGETVVQLYVRDEVASVSRPVRQLRGFRRIHLAPGERTTVAFSLTGDDLAFRDRALRRVVEPGTFRVFVGASSRATLGATFEVAAR